MTDMPAVWGSTMERDAVDWDDEPTAPRAEGWTFNKNITEIVRYFGYHPSMSMNQVFDDKSKTAVAAWVARRFRAGFTAQQLKRAVDRFFQSYAKDYKSPAFAFVSNEMQERIFDGDRATQSDPILEWISSGMPDDGPFDNPRGIRSLLLLRCHEGLLRYPDIVLQILRSHGTMRSKEGMLTALEYIIQWNLGKYDDRGELKLCQKILRNFDLPTELASPQRGNLRDAATDAVRSVEKMTSTKGYHRGIRAD